MQQPRARAERNGLPTSRRTRASGEGLAGQVGPLEQKKACHGRQCEQEARGLAMVPRKETPNTSLKRKPLFPANPGSSRARTEPDQPLLYNCVSGHTVPVNHHRTRDKIQTPPSAIPDEVTGSATIISICTLLLHLRLLCIYLITCSFVYTYVQVRTFLPRYLSKTIIVK